MDISKRNAVRIVSFTVAVVGVLAVRNIQLMSSEKRALRSVNYTYSRAMGDLCDAVENVSDTLEKELYAGSGKMHQSLAVGFHRIIMIRVVLTSENIVIVIAFIECAENWQGQIQCHCSFEVIGCVVIFDQKLTIQGTGLYTHKVAVRACGEIGIDGCSPGFIVLRFQIASLVSIADCF